MEKSLLGSRLCCMSSFNSEDAVVQVGSLSLALVTIHSAPV